MVSLTNLHYASKKKDEKQSYSYEKESTEYDEEEVNKKLLQSRLDLLFGRYKLVSKQNIKQALDTLTSSIITYSEIYGPESVGLTPQYFYLAEYFLEADVKNKEAIAKNIYLKIADIWKMYFTKSTNPLFLENNDKVLILAIGETYVKSIITKLSGILFKDSESELYLKFRIIKVIILRKNNSDLHQSELNNVLELKRQYESKIIDKEFMEDLEKKWTKEMKKI